jgi:hypothetical protein
VQDTIDEVLLANLMQRMEDRGEVFEHVAEYCVYLVLVYERTDGSRALVGAYVGSAGRRGQSYLCAYEHRAGDRNRSILNHAGKGDSNLSVFLASKKAAIASGTLAEDATSTSKPPSRSWLWLRQAACRIDPRAHLFHLVSVPNLGFLTKDKVLSHSL